jgi:D-3-phosphoglycerate dehydrogenase
MARILITDGIEKNAAQQLSALGHDVIDRSFTQEELSDEIRRCDVIIVRSATQVDKALLDSALETRRLFLIIRAGVGVDNIDVTYAHDQNILVENTPQASSRAVAELTIGHMFALARHLYHANVTMRSGLWAKKAYQGIELGHKTLGLIGFGRIARETARLAQALGMRVIYHTRSGKKADAPSCEAVSLDELLRTADFISLHVPHDPQRGAVIGPREFACMKNGVYLINCARGGVVDEEALIQALDSGKVAAAALDVFGREPVLDKRIYQHEKISLTPHLGASTVEAQARIGQEIVEIVKRTCAVRRVS